MKGKIFLYTILYMLISVASAFGAIKLSSSLQNGSINKSESAPYQLTQIVSNLQSSEYMTLDLQIEINNNDSSSIISLDAKTNIPKDNEDLKLEGNFNILSQNESINLNFAYLNQNIYLEIQDNKVYFEYDKIKEPLSQILNSVFGFVGLDLSTMNINDILLMLKNLTETKNKNDILLKIDVPFIGKLNLITDLKYRLKQFNIPTFTINDNSSISMQGKIEYPQNIEIDRNIENYTNITNIVVGATDLLSKNVISLDLNANVYNTPIKGSLDFEPSTLNTKLSFYINDNEINLLLLKDTLYAEIGNLYISLDLDDIDKLNNLLNESFNISLPKELIINIISSIQNKDLENLINIFSMINFNLNDLNLSKLDFSFLNNIVTQGNTTFITIEDLGNISLTTENNKFSNLSITNANFDLNFNSCPTREINLKTDLSNYVDFVKFIPTIETLYDLLKENQLTGNFNLNILGINVPVKFNLNLKEDIFATLKTNILGLPIDVNLIDKNIYLQIANLKLYSNLNEILQTENVFNQIYTVSTYIFSLFNSETNLIENLVQTENGFIIQTKNINMEIQNLDNSLMLIISSDIFEISGTISKCDELLTKPNIDTNDYDALNSFFPILDNLLKSFVNENHYFDLKANFNDIVLDGFIDINNNNITAQINIINNTNNEAFLYLKDNVIYFNINEAKIAFSINEIDILQNYLKEYFGLEFKEITEFLTSIISIENLQYILENSNVYFTNDSFSICNKNFTLQLNFENNYLYQFTILNSNFNCELNIVDNYHSIKEIDFNNYNQLTDIIEIIGKTFNSISQEQIAFNLELNYKNLEIYSEIKIDYINDMFEISLNINNQKILIYIKNEIIYLNYENIFVKFSLNQILDFSNTIQNNIGLNIPLDQILLIYDCLKTKNLTNALKLINFNEFNFSNFNIFALKNLIAKENYLEIEIDNLAIAKLTLNEYGFNSLQIDGIFDLNLSINEFEEINILNTEKYLSLDVIIPTLQNFTEIISNDFLYGNGNINIKNQNFNFDYEISTNNNIIIKFNLYLSSQVLSITYFENTFYIDYSNTKLYFSINDIDKITQFISNTFNVDLNIDYVFKTLKNLISSNNDDYFIKNVSPTENGFIINTQNNFIINFTADDSTSSFQFEGSEFNIKLNLFISNNILQINKPIIQEYTDICQILDHITYIYNYVKDGSINLEISGSLNQYLINGYLNYENDNISAILNISQKETNLEIIFYENCVYLTYNNIKLKFGLDELNLLNQFTMNYLEIDILSYFNQFSDSLFNIDEILNLLVISINDSYLNLNYKDLLINIYLSNDNNYNASILYKNLNLNINLLKNKVYIYPTGKYSKLSDAMNLLNTLVDFLSKKQFDLGLTFNINDQVVYGNFQFDLKNQFQFGATIYSNTVEKMNLKMYTENDWSYFNLNGLLLKMNNSSFKQSIYILLNAFGINTSFLRIFDDINLDLDFSGIQSNFNFLTDMAIENAVEFMSYIKSLKIDTYNFIITFDGTKIYNNPNAKDLSISFISNGSRISTILIENLYSDDNLTDILSISLSVNYFSYISKLDKNLNYYDISGINDILKSVVNMSNYNDFTLTGTMNVVGELIGIKISYDINYKLFIKILENGKFEIYGEIGAIPVIAGVNNDVPYQFGDTDGGYNRYLYFYYKDGYVYLYRKENISIMFGASSRVYEKTTKIPLSHLLQNIGYYIQYCLGLQNNIMDSINNSLNSKTGFINWANVLVGYSQSNSNYNFIINMAEISGNNLLGNLNLSMGLSNDNQGKNYIKNFSYSLYMPLSSTFSLTISSNNTSIVNFGESVDMASLYNFISSYQYAPFEEWQANNGSWTKVK